MKITKKILIVIAAVLMIALPIALPAQATTFLPIITMKPYVTSLIPLPTTTPSVSFPTITSYIPLPTNTFDFTPVTMMPIPVDVLTKWKNVNDTDPLYMPVDVIADRQRVKILDWQNGGRLSVYDIESDTWYYLEPPASIGSMAFPFGLCEGPNDSVYIADTYKNRILQCSSNGAWSVVEDSGFSAPSAVLYYKNTLYVADTGNDRIRYLQEGVWKEITKVGLSVTFSSLTDIKMKNGGGMLIADGGNDYIINREAYTKMYSFISDSTYTDQFIKMYPDENNDLYITSTSSDALVKFDGTDFIKIMSSGSNLGQVNNPAGVFDDGMGTIYVADMGNNRVQRNFSSENTLIDFSTDGTTVTGFSPATQGYTLQVPEGKTSIDLSAVATSPYADIAGDLGSMALSYGENVFTVTVSPEWGSDKDYTLTITRQSPTPTPTDEPTATPEVTSTPPPVPSPSESTVAESSEVATNTPDAESTQEQLGENNQDSESDASAESPSKQPAEQIPIWMIVLLTVLGCAVVAVTVILIYMMKKGKTPNDKDFE